MESFVVVPKGTRPEFGFWLQAENSEEAIRLVSLNVPNMGDITNAGNAACSPSRTYSPIHGAIMEGFGRNYIITRRSSKNINRT